MNVVEYPTAVEDPRIVTLLISVAKKTRAVVGLRLAEIGLSPGEDNILLSADVRRPAEAENLARSLGIRFSTLQRSVDQLVAQGQLERRGEFIDLTQKGKSLLPRILCARASLADDLEASLGRDAVERMAGSLEILENELSRFLTPAA